MNGICFLSKREAELDARGVVHVNKDTINLTRERKSDLDEWRPHSQGLGALRLHDDKGYVICQMIVSRRLATPSQLQGSSHQLLHNMSVSMLPSA